MDTTQGFDFYEGTTTAHSQEPRITVRRGGLMVLTPASVDLLGESVTHVQLGFNPKTNMVAIRHAADDAKGRYRLRSQKNSPMLLVGGKKFFQHHDLTVEQARTYTARDFGNGLVGFTLDGTVELPRPTKLAEAVPAPKKTVERKIKTAA